MPSETFTNWQELRDREVEGSRKGSLRPKTENQSVFMKAIEKSVVTICVGPAGTGKTHIACAEAARSLRDGRVKKIIICRPMVTCSGTQGKGIGFLPGDVKEKVSPYMRPLLDAFGEFFEPAKLNKFLYDGTVEMIPLELMRGMSIKGSFVILDEAQNAEFEQLYMVMTRFDRGTKLVITGDDSRRQNDLRGGCDGLDEVVHRFTRRRHKDISIVRLERKDIVRHPLIQFIDEVMGAPSSPLGEPESEAWFDVRCTSCNTRIWYEDEVDSGEVDHISCFSCGQCIQLWTENDYYEPHPCALKKDAAPTYPERP